MCGRVIIQVPLNIGEYTGGGSGLLLPPLVVGVHHAEQMLGRVIIQLPLNIGYLQGRIQR